MVNTKMLVGLGFLGVAVYAYSQLEMPTTTNGDLPPNGGGLYVPPNGNGDDDIYGPDCSSMWDASGNRINDGWVSHGQQYFKDRRYNCDLDGFDVRVYTDKSVYYAGEPIQVVVLKQYFETQGRSSDWHEWTTQNKKYGERLAFLFGIEGDKVLRNFQYTPGSLYTLPSSFNLLSSSEREGYGVVKYTVRTTANDEGVYDLRFATQLGPYNRTNLICGHKNNCLTHKKSGSKRCNIKETDSPRKITVLSKDCKNPPQASSAEPSFSRRRRKKEKKPKDDCEYCCTEVNGTKCYGCGKNPDTRCNRCIDKCYESTKKPKTLSRMSEEWISSQSFLTEWV